MVLYMVLLVLSFALPVVCVFEKNALEISVISFLQM